MSAAYIHILGDIIQSVGVIIAAVIIKIFGKEYEIVDPICTIFFAVIVLFTTTPVIKKAISVLLEAMPDSIDYVKLKQSIEGVKGVINIHDLHVWSITHGKNAMSVHVLGDNTNEKLLKDVTKVVRKFKIYHSTIQLENQRHNIRDTSQFIDCTHNIHQNNHNDESGQI